MGWQKSIIQGLIHHIRPDGGWGYRAGMNVHTEPTALSCLALCTHHTHSDVVYQALKLLKKMQKPDGSVPVSSIVDTTNWATGLCLLAWLHCGDEYKDQFEKPVINAMSWLLGTRGKRLKLQPDIMGHDTTLQGWPWVEHTHSWAEPTSYAVMALRANGQHDHPRVREGIELLLDRALPDGGWNYGNTRTLGQILQPFPCTTGIVLTALKGVPDDNRIDESIRYLKQELLHIRSPLSLCWGLIGLSSWNARPRESRRWLTETAKRTMQREHNALHSAMLLLADAQHNPLIPAPVSEVYRV